MLCFAPSYAKEHIKLQGSGKTLFYLWKTLVDASSFCIKIVPKCFPRLWLIAAGWQWENLNSLWPAEIIKLPFPPCPAEIQITKADSEKSKPIFEPKKDKKSHTTPKSSSIWPCAQPGFLQDFTLGSDLLRTQQPELHNIFSVGMFSQGCAWMDHRWVRNASGKKNKVFRICCVLCHHSLLLFHTLRLTGILVPLSIYMEYGGSAISPVVFWTGTQQRASQLCQTQPFNHSWE